MYVDIKESDIKNKKWTATFYDSSDRKKIKTTHFGHNKYEDYTQHHDDIRKAAYIRRHQKNEDWNDFMSAGSLSRYILWEHKDFDKAVKAYMKRFNLKPL